MVVPAELGPTRSVTLLDLRIILLLFDGLHVVLGLAYAYGSSLGMWAHFWISGGEGGNGGHFILTRLDVIHASCMDG